MRRAGDLPRNRSREERRAENCHAPILYVDSMSIQVTRTFLFILRKAPAGRLEALLSLPLAMLAKLAGSPQLWQYSGAETDKPYHRRNVRKKLWSRGGAVTSTALHSSTGTWNLEDLPGWYLRLNASAIVFKIPGRCAHTLGL
jgi:hypothetical protein